MTPLGTPPPTQEQEQEPKSICASLRSTPAIIVPTLVFAYVDLHISIDIASVLSNNTQSYI